MLTPGVWAKSTRSLGSQVCVEVVWIPANQADQLAEECPDPRNLPRRERPPAC